MPNRIIKESIRTSKSINAMTDFQFRLWTYLITYVDDYGRGSADPELIKGLVFPRRKGLTEAQIRDGLVNLANIGSIHLYDVDGESYLCFPNWSDHQRIQTKHSKFPEPPADYRSHVDSTVTHGGSPSESNSNPNPNPNPNPRESTARMPRFAPPTIDDVKNYCSEHGYAVDPQRFVDYYTANGWKVGKNPMKDWQATVRSWANRDRETVSRPSLPVNPALNYEQRSSEETAYNRLFVNLDDYGKE